MEKLVWPKMSEMQMRGVGPNPYAAIDREISGVPEGALFEGESLSRVTTIIPDVADVNEAERIPEEKQPKGVEEAEQKRNRYEWQLIFLKTASALTSISLWATGIWVLVKQPGKEPVLQNRRVDNWSNQFGWMFEGGEQFDGGKQFMNMLMAAKTDEIDLNDRKTWGYKTGFTGRFWEGGNNFGEKARIAVSWSDKLMTPEGRQELIQAAGANNTGISKFNEEMNKVEQQKGQKAEWGDVEMILKEKFGFEQRYLDVLRELRVEYFTGDGNLRGAIEAAQKVSALEDRVVEEQKIATADELVGVMGISSQIDGQTVSQIAAVIPGDYSMSDTVMALGQIVPEWRPELSREYTALTGTPPTDIWMQPAGEVKQAMISPALGFIISIGFLAREGVPAVGKWAKKRLEELSESHPNIKIFLEKHKQ